MSAYQYEIKYWRTQAHFNADQLSRLSLNKGHFEGHYDKPGIFKI